MNADLRVIIAPNPELPLALNLKRNMIKGYFLVVYVLSV